MSIPSIKMRPDSWSINRKSVSISDDLPEPVRPTMPTDMPPCMHAHNWHCRVTEGPIRSSTNIGRCYSGGMDEAIRCEASDAYSAFRAY